MNKVIQNVTKEDCAAEIIRFYKNYYQFCKSPDYDAVREVLSSAYSVNDKLRKSGYPDFFNNNYFVSLKSVRNYAIHQAELQNQSKAISFMGLKEVNSEISLMCILPIAVINKIIDEADKKAKNTKTKQGRVDDSVVQAIKSSFVFYKKYVDIYPCIFNFGVSLYFLVKKEKIHIISSDFLNLENSIKYEAINGIPHYIGGKMSLWNGGCFDDYLDTALISMTELSIELKAVEVGDDGMYKHTREVTKKEFMQVVFGYTDKES